MEAHCRGALGARPGRSHARALARPAVLAAALAAGSCSGARPPSPAAPDVPEVDCSVFAAAGASAYVLPFGVGAGFTVSRTFEHYTTANGGVGLYAIDFPMPVGTTVHAARAGTVVAVEERFKDGDRAEYHENWVMIRHSDGTVARYIHLTADGAQVEVGDVVEQGQAVGRSGDSGPSSGPHLHFDVQSCGPNLPPGYNRPPCGATVPVSFRNTAPHACGLEKGRTYTALDFMPDAR